MRISDWSSDVCSSDLVDAEVDLRVVDVGRIVGAGEMQADARKLLAEAAEPRHQPERQQGGHTAYRQVAAGRGAGHAQGRGGDLDEGGGEGWQQGGAMRR